MVLRMTGASWLASMMRSEREGEDRRDASDWLLCAPIEPEVVEAVERLATQD